MSFKTEDLFVIDCDCKGCFYHHKDEVYLTKKEAEKEIKNVKSENGAEPKIVTLNKQHEDIKYWFY